MSDSELENAIFKDETLAREWLESELWPHGPACPHCDVLNRATKVQGKSHRPGLYMCNECRQQFTVTVGTVFERSHIPLNKWLLAVFLLSASKKGISTHQLHRMLGLSYKSAWFMTHRIREAMRDGSLAPFGGDSGMSGNVEVDETFIGREPGMPKKRGGYSHKMKVLSLVDRENSKVRSIVINDLSAATIVPILEENIIKEASIMTDEAGQYGSLGKKFIDHQTVNHSEEEYVRGDVHTNTVEGYFSIFKRGMKGVYQHCGKQHLHRYLAEFDFRYNTRVKFGINDTERARAAVKGAVGKRLTYRRPDSEAARP